MPDREFRVRRRTVKVMDRRVQAPSRAAVESMLKKEALRYDPSRDEVHFSVEFEIEEIREGEPGRPSR